MIDVEAFHSDRKIKLNGGFDSQLNKFNHNARLSLAQDAWLTYHASIINLTTISLASQAVSIRIGYPRRNFSIGGLYALEGSLLHSEANISWEGDTQFSIPKTRRIGAFLTWSNNSVIAEQTYEHNLTFGLRHPSLPKDVTVEGRLLRGPASGQLISVGLLANYSLEETKLLSFGATLWNDSELPLRRR
ncbi:hypothetical protein QAD02_007127 [Eretmocerus hayati]|uniref:Uncharacterized protein n=1 Tax=Eretmocerus hayati TaxID=131215 RepID=A0ACC2N2R4_9HYME|nr:hypothetical protein QAD02_007127 [Eretmocerus hayati]